MSAYDHLIDEEAGYGKPNSGFGASDEMRTFAERTVRQGFIRKVLGLLSAQLLVTLATTLLFTLHTPTKKFVLSSPWLLLTSLGLSFGLMLYMGLSETARRSHPTNLIVLGLFTAAESILVGTVACTYSPTVVLMAVGVTAGVVAGLAVFSMQSKFDMTPHSGALFGLFMALFTASILQMFLHAKLLHLVLCAGGVVLFSAYLMFDLQLVMGGHKYAISPDEYVFATLNLYLDIINLFLYILQIINEATNRQ